MNDLVKQQIALEEQFAQRGAEEYTRRVNKLKAKGFEGATRYGVDLLQEAFDAVYPATLAWMRGASLAPARRATALLPLSQVKTDVAVLIACRHIIDGISRDRPMTRVAIGIGREIEEESRVLTFQRQNQNLFNGVKWRLDRHPLGKSTQVRRSTIAHSIKKFNIAIKEWDNRTRLLVGLKLIELFVQSTGLVKPYVQRKDRTSTTYVIAPQPLLMDWIEKRNDSGAFLSPLKRPMICPPRKWSGLTGGGYYTSRLAGNLVRSRTKGYGIEIQNAGMPKVYNAINHLQETAWKVNKDILAVVETLLGVEGLYFPGWPRPSYAVPPQEPNFNTHPEEWKKWKTLVAQMMRDNISDNSSRIRVRSIRQAANEFKDRGAIYFPHQLDFRGRAYPIPSMLSPQGCDLAKGLLTFAKAIPLGQGGYAWLGVHVANTFGVDKIPFDDRVDWVFDNEPKIYAVATDPVANLWWTEADKPWQFLAACKEWYAARHFPAYQGGPEAYPSSLPVVVDGSCNGIQLYAMAMRDEVAGRFVNCEPAEKPADIYAEVARRLVLRLEDAVKNGVSWEAASQQKHQIAIQAWDKAQKRWKAKYDAWVAGGKAGKEPKAVSKPRQSFDPSWPAKWLAFGIDRKLCKRPVMVLPYSGTRQAFREYILERAFELRKERVIPFDRELHHASTWLAIQMWEVTCEVVIGPRVAMDWLKKCVQQVYKAGDKNAILTWTTPSGFVVQQYRPKVRTKPVETSFGGGRVMLYVASEESNKVDTQAQASAVAPNLIHSIDASVLAETINACREVGVNSFTAVHDCYGTHAAHMDDLSRLLREAAVRVFEGNDVLEQWRAAIQPLCPIELPLPPLKGSLDLKKVLESPFFFA